MDYRYNKMYYDEAQSVFRKVDKVIYLLSSADVTCTNEIQKPKTFSWEEAFQLCQDANATLPEFYSRKEQEEFIDIIRSEEVYPIEAVFIGLYYNTKVIEFFSETPTKQ